MKKTNGAFNRISGRVAPENKIFINLGLEIARQIKTNLANHPEIKTQKALAEKLGKEESEVSRWLSGLHNLTLESISKVSAALNEDVIMTDLMAREKYGVIENRHVERIEGIRWGVQTSSSAWSDGLNAKANCYAQA